MRARNDTGAAWPSGHGWTRRNCGRARRASHSGAGGPRLISGGELPDPIAPLGAGSGSALAALGAEVQEADDGVIRLETERLLDRGIVGRRTGLPHGIEAEHKCREHHGVRGCAGGERLLDDRYLDRGVAVSRDYHDERRAERLEPLALQALLPALRVHAAQLIGEQR